MLQCSYSCKFPASSIFSSAGWRWWHPVGARSCFRWKLHPSSQAWPLLPTSNRGETAIAKCGNSTSPTHCSSTGTRSTWLWNRPWFGGPVDTVSLRKSKSSWREPLHSELCRLCGNCTKSCQLATVLQAVWPWWRHPLMICIRSSLIDRVTGPLILYVTTP